MGQVTIYLDDETERRMREAAEAAHLSKSKWVARLICTHVADNWPKEVVSLAGAWRDLPTAEDLRAGEGVDTRREDL
ncbi:MAG: CopG family transcriptional regulator [Deferrisomatales bacterium]